MVLCGITDNVPLVLDGSYGGKSIYSLSVGGKKEFCVTIAIKSDDMAYIDRVEYSDFCVPPSAKVKNP